MMNIRLITDCEQCWKQPHIMADYSNCSCARIEWDPLPIPNSYAIVKVTYRFLSEPYQKSYKVYGHKMPLSWLYDILGSITGIQIVFRYVDPHYLLTTESDPISLSNLQIYTIRDKIGTASYLYGDMSAY